MLTTAAEPSNCVPSRLFRGGFRGQLIPASGVSEYPGLWMRAQQVASTPQKISLSTVSAGKRVGPGAYSMDG
jgi:hypothetical protein